MKDTEAWVLETSITIAMERSAGTLALSSDFVMAALQEAGSILAAAMAL